MKKAYPFYQFPHLQELTSDYGPKPKYRDVRDLVAIRWKADMRRTFPEDQSLTQLRHGLAALPNR